MKNDMKEAMYIWLGYDKGEMEEWYTEFFKCKKCGSHNIAKGFNYCPGCGIRIEWKEI